jgi:hypothetical protein
MVVLTGAQALMKLVPDPGTTGNWAGRPGMAVWQPGTETLYYRQNGDVWRWTAAGGAQRYLPGVNWYYPTFSADGRYLAYAVQRPDGLHDVYLIDVSSGKAQRIGGGARTLPLFLNSTQLWFETDSTGVCGPSGNQPLIYDISDGTEAPSSITRPVGVWPATSSNF